MDINKLLNIKTGKPTYYTYLNHHMKALKTIFIAGVLMTSYTLSAQIAINTDGTDPDNSAMLDVKSTEKGLLLPRMTTQERNAISSPADGLLIFNTDIGSLDYYYDNAWHPMISDDLLAEDEVLNPVTGRIWKDRNLGASQVATSSTDAAAYGDLYQWGRATEGHQVRTSGTTSTNATTAVPNSGNAWDGLFITEVSEPYDWLTPQDNTLWQGVGGTNNPCPGGFRLPTEAEWEAERLSWSSNNAAGAFASPLKLPMAGYRDYDDGSVYNEGTSGIYWSSTVDGVYARLLGFVSSNANAGEGSDYRASGVCVRCIKD